MRVGLAPDDAALGFEGGAGAGGDMAKCVGDEGERNEEVLAQGACLQRCFA